MDREPPSNVNDHESLTAMETQSKATDPHDEKSVAGDTSVQAYPILEEERNKTGPVGEDQNAENQQNLKDILGTQKDVQYIGFHDNEQMKAEAKVIFDKENKSDMDSAPSVNATGQKSLTVMETQSKVLQNETINDADDTLMYACPNLGEKGDTTGSAIEDKDTENLSINKDMFGTSMEVQAIELHDRESTEAEAKDMKQTATEQGFMSSLLEKQYFRLIKFSYDISFKVARAFTTANVLNCYKNYNFADFLNVHKHKIYHLWNNNTKCCACDDPSKFLQKTRELNEEQFNKLFDRHGFKHRGHFKRGTRNSVIQHCMCGISAATSSNLKDLDVILIHAILRKCVKLEQEDEMWLQTLRKIRNKIAHVVSTTCFDQGRLEKWWFKLEGSVLGLAKKVPPSDCYAEVIEDRIDQLKNKDLDKSDVEEFLQKIAVENSKICSKQRELTENLMNKVDDIKQEIKQEIIQQFEQEKEILVDFKNVVFEVRTGGLHQQEKTITADKTRMSSQKDQKTCRVEWYLTTPDDWEVQFITEKLNACKCMLKGVFEIDFVYVGSLVIQTSVQEHVLSDMNLLAPAVRSFLEKMVEMCEIDTETTTTVPIDLSIEEGPMPPSNMLCDPCKIQQRDIPGVNWCPDCDETLCMGCASHHKSQKATQTHSVVDINFKIELPEELSKQQYCIDHAERQVEFYCPVHDATFCKLCLPCKHRCDGVIHLDVACENDKKSLLEEVGREIRSIQKSVVNLADETDKNVLDINSASQTIETQTAHAKEQAIKAINENEKMMLSNLQTERDNALEKQNEIKGKCQTIESKLITYSNVIQSVQEHGSDKQAFLLARHFKPELEKINDSVSAVLSSATMTSLRFDERKDLIPSILTLGSINKSEQLGQVKHSPRIQRYAQCFVTRIEKPLTSFKLTTTFRTSNEAIILGMIGTDDDKLLLCNYNTKHEVLVYNDNCEFVGAIKMEDDPFDITNIPGVNKYIVTLPDINSIQYITSQDLKPGNTVRLPVKNCTYGVAANEQYIYIGEYSRILVLDIDGNVNNEIKLNWSGYVDYLAINGNILYAGNQSDNIYSIEQNKTIRRANTPGVGAIRKIVVDRQGFIYFGGQRSGKVHRLDKDMKQFMTIDVENVTKIGAICFNEKCTKLFVASDTGKTIAVFSCT